MATKFSKHRRQYLKGVAALPVLSLAACGGGTNQPAALQSPDTSSNTPLPQLTLDEGVWGSDQIRRFKLNAQLGSSSLLSGTSSATAGYNGSLLGPALRLRRGEKTEIAVSNSLGQETTTHWHGLVVPSEMDGSPHQLIAPGATWTAGFTVENEAMTGWYHPHVHGNTGAQVIKGLAGMLLVDDPSRPVNNMPSSWGVDDLGLVLKDWRFTNNGEIDYTLTSTDNDIGYQASRLYVNGAFGPVWTAPRQWVRLRLLNACNARTLVLRLDNGAPIYQIAHEGGWLQQPVAMSSITLLAAQRAEVMIELGTLSLSGELRLMASTPATGSMMAGGIGFSEVIALRIKTSGVVTANAVTALPATLPAPAPLATTASTALRKFSLEGGMHTNDFTISGVPFAMSRIDFTVSAASTELWQFTNNTMMTHPIHVHGVRMNVLSRNGVAVPAHEQGLRDTFAVESMGDAVVAVAMPAAPSSKPLMMHCHILEHEDVGMMRQFMVV